MNSGKFWENAYHPLKSSVLIHGSTDKHEVGGQMPHLPGYFLSKKFARCEFFKCSRTNLSRAIIFAQRGLRLCVRCLTKGHMYSALAMNYRGIFAYRMQRNNVVYQHKKTANWTWEADFKRLNPTVHTRIQCTTRRFSQLERPDGPPCCSFKRVRHKCDLCDVALITCHRKRLGQEPKTMSCASIAL